MDSVGRLMLEEGPAGHASEALHTQGAGQERPEGSPPPIQGVHPQQWSQLQGRPEGEG